MIKRRVKIKHFSIIGLMSPGWVRTHSDFCWTHGLGLGLGPTGLGLGLGLWSNGLWLWLGLWSNGLGLTPDGLGLWPDGLGLWPCGLGLTAGLTSPDSLQHCYIPLPYVVLINNYCYEKSQVRITRDESWTFHTRSFSYPVFFILVHFHTRAFSSPYTFIPVTKSTVHSKHTHVW